MMCAVGMCVLSPVIRFALFLFNVFHRLVISDDAKMRIEVMRTRGYDEMRWGCMRRGPVLLF